jgi:hypothetical protein
MLTLSMGYKKPETGDKGSEFFPALEDNTQRLNDHNHQGSNSQKLSTLASESVVQSVLSAAWVHQGGGNYRATVTLPAGLDFDTCVPQFRLSSGHLLHLTVDKISDTQFYAYINDPVDVLVLYTS